MTYRRGKWAVILLVTAIVVLAVGINACRDARSGSGSGPSSSAESAASPLTVVDRGVPLEPGETEAAIIFSGSLHGMIAACGCEGNPSGGMTKELTVVNRIREKGYPTLYVNPGDAFPYQKRPAKMPYIAEALAAMRYDAMAIGEQELIEGIPRFKELATKTSLPYLSENLNDLDGKRLAPGCVIKDLAGIKVGIFAVIGDESYLYFKSDFFKTVRITPVADAIRKCLDELRGRADYIVMLSHQDKYLDRDLMGRFPEIDLIIGGHDEELMTTPVLVGNTLRVAAGAAGDYVGVVHLAVDPRRHIRVLSAELVPATAQVAPDATVQAIYNRYVAESNEPPDAIADPLPEAYQSSETCEPCHKAIYKEYLTTKHARAWETLVRVGRTEDRECWQCHSMGYGRKSGFESIQKTPELANVSCQACHLATHDHNDRKIKDDLDYARNQKVCEQCHTVVTAPNFNYWDQFDQIDHHKVKEKSNDPPPGYKHWRVTPVHPAPPSARPSTDVPATSDKPATAP